MEEKTQRQDSEKPESFSFIRTRKGMLIALFIIIGSFLLLFPWPWKYNPQLLWGWLPSSVLWWFSYYIIVLIIFIFIARDWYRDVKGKYKEATQEDNFR